MKKVNLKKSIKSKKEKIIDECEAKYDFKSNSWKITIVIILVIIESFIIRTKLTSKYILEFYSNKIFLQVSFLVRSLIYEKFPKHQKPVDEFVQLVPEKYADSELVEWTPAPAPIDRPGEPGNLGF